MAETINEYGASKIIDFAIKGLDQKRPLFFQKFFPEKGISFKDDINFDIGFDRKNLLGQLADPESDMDAVKLPDFATGTIYGAYTKEICVSPSYNEISQRDFGTQQSEVATKNLASSYMAHMAEQLRLAYQRMENLHEYVTSKILLEGKVVLTSPYAKTVVWDFNRLDVTNTTTASNSKAQSDAYDAVYNELAPQIDLTTHKANYKGASFNLVGGMSWDNFGYSTPSAPIAFGTNDLHHKVSPVKDLQRMIEIALWGAGVDVIVMNDMAYSWFIKDIRDNYAETYDLTKMTTDPRIALEIIPKIRDLEGLDFRMMWKTGSGMTVPIYTNRSGYWDVATKSNVMYMPNDKGRVLLIPAPSYGATKFGRVEHLKAAYNPMKTFINVWKNEKTGREAWELHRKFFHYHMAINSCVMWTVCSTSVK